MDERSLVSSLLAGDEGAQEAFDRAYRRRLYATAVHFLGYQDPEAEDVVQETLLVAHQKLPGFEFRSGLYLWLNHICVNHCLRRLHKRHKLLSADSEELEALSWPGAQAAERQREVQAEVQGRAGAAQRALAQMEKGCRRILELRHLKEQSYAQIGRALKLPLGTVMSRLARCRERLRGILRAQGALS